MPPKIRGFEFSSIDGMIVYRERRKDGSLGQEERTGIDTAQTEAFLRFRERLYRAADLKPSFNRDR